MDSRPEHGDADTLALPAGEFMRVAIDEEGIQTHLLQQVFDIFLRCFLGMMFVNLERAPLTMLPTVMRGFREAKGS